MLLLVLGSEPPLRVAEHGRLGLEAAVDLHLQSVLEDTEGFDAEHETLLRGLPEVRAWTTWQEVRRVVERQGRPSRALTSRWWRQ